MNLILHTYFIATLRTILFWSTNLRFQTTTTFLKNATSYFLTDIFFTNSPNYIIINRSMQLCCKPAIKCCNGLSHHSFSYSILKCFRWKIFGQLLTQLQPPAKRRRVSVQPALLNSYIIHISKKHKRNPIKS